MMIIIIPIKRPATRPGFEKKPPPETESDATIEGDVDSGVKVTVLVPSEGEAVVLDVGSAVVVELDVELDVVLVDVDD